MRIERTDDIWKIAPSTGDERRVLEFLFTAFVQSYGKVSPITTESSTEAKHSPLPPPVPRLGVEGL